MNKCPVCDKYYEPHRKNQRTCLDADCKRIDHNEYLRIHAAEKRKMDRARINEYNRLWMREYRARQKELKPKEDTLKGVDYAERQMARTLAMAGKVKL